jgi:hypothetical protein
LSQALLRLTTRSGDRVIARDRVIGKCRDHDSSASATRKRNGISEKNPIGLRS